MEEWNMRTKEIIRSQYRAALEMLRQAIVSCPADLWHSPEYKNQFWHVAYHTIFYAHLYLHPSEDDFVPWEKHRDDIISLEDWRQAAEGLAGYTKDDLLAYHRLCLEQMEEQVDAMDLEAESGFYWLPFDKLELQFYNIRHIQQHTGELCERLGTRADVEVDWVGTVGRA
jgi:hypothetical protein